MPRPRARACAPDRATAGASSSTSRSGANSGAVGDAVQRANTSRRCASIHAATSAPGGRDRRSPTCAERLERRHADDAPPVHEREPLHRRDADAQAGERARARRDGEQIDRRDSARPCASAQRRAISRGQPLGVRPRRIAARARRRRDRRRRARRFPRASSCPAPAHACGLDFTAYVNVGDAGDASVPRRQAAASRRHPALPHGRLLRDVLRRRPRRRARARADAHLALEGRQRRRHPDVRRAVSRRRRLHRAARQEGLPRRDLRSGRGSAQGQGPRQARGRARRLARHADRRRATSTRASRRS